MIGGLVKFESNFKPDDSFRESNGNWSVGLMALSPKECRSYETVDLLKQPLLNLSCGIGKFADLVVREVLDRLHRERRDERVAQIGRAHV